MLIGIIGPARSGKDTIANFLVKDYDFQKMSFADPIREALVALDPIVSFNGTHTHLSQLIDTLTWDEIKAGSPEIRGLLQRMGTEVGQRMFGKNLWVDMTFKNASGIKDLVIPDVRFLHEVAAIKNRGGIIIRVTKPNIGPANSHVSEHQLANYEADYVIGNRGTLHQLSAKVNILMSSMSAWS